MAQKIILGIDPGIADTGYGLIKLVPGKNPECVAYGSIKTSLKFDLPTRLVQLAKELNGIIKKYQPEAVAIEQLFFNKNVKTALVVGQARGVALLILKQNALPIYEFTPGQVKQAVSCYGKADKKQVQKMVKMLLRLKEIPQPDDAADALAMALTLSATNLWPKN
ncbi:MAG TPA: crossover junction endodeoxyribonuclease RuvC [bacterium]|nr:crossover junction endodeoxyribonuclease RuvC [bacterium]HPT29440.1 crossover junction endodeoxyribonuclease RuvC [bacterium]